VVVRLQGRGRRLGSSQFVGLAMIVGVLSMPLTGSACGRGNCPAGAPATTLTTTKAPTELFPDLLAPASQVAEVDEGQTGNGQLFHLS
jgi:hypothetical protein